MAASAKNIFHPAWGTLPKVTKSSKINMLAFCHTLAASIIVAYQYVVRRVSDCRHATIFSHEARGRLVGVRSRACDAGRSRI